MRSNRLPVTTETEGNPMDTARNCLSRSLLKPIYPGKRPRGAGADKGSGALRQRYRITILRRVEETNTVGEIVYHWKKGISTWAEIHEDKTITIRYQRGAVMPGYRVIIRGETLE